MENSTKFSFKVCSLPSNELIFENALFVNDKDYETIKKQTNSKALVYGYVKGSLMQIKSHSGVQQGHIAIAKLFREALGVSEQIGQVDFECKVVNNIRCFRCTSSE
jgi:hypothetical protein